MTQKDLNDYSPATVLKVFKDLGGVPAFLKWAESNPKDFYAIYLEVMSLREARMAKSEIVP
jgi:hypothetical protein